MLERLDRMAPTQSLGSVGGAAPPPRDPKQGFAPPPGRGSAAPTLPKRGSSTLPEANQVASGDRATRTREVLSNKTFKVLGKASERISSRS
jgi:hypothetical protein